MVGIIFDNVFIVLKGYYQPLSILLGMREEAWVGFVWVCEWARVHKDLGLVEIILVIVPSIWS